MKYSLSLLLLFLSINLLVGQVADTTQIDRGEYPYVLPILGKKAYERGYNLPLPFSASVGTVYNKQGLVLDNFSMDFTKGDQAPNFDRLQPISDLVVFGPSEGRINTMFGRIEAWVLPFLSVGVYGGKVWGEQTIALTSPIEITSNTEIDGQYFGFNLVGVVPLGPVVLQGDYSWSWTTNERLDEAVLVKVSGMRLLKRFVSKKNPDSFFAFWGGAQFQNLADKTSGKIGLGEALNLTPEDIDEFDMRWEDYMMSPEWDTLTPSEKIRATAAYNIVRGAAEELSGTTVHYRFDKRLEFEWNMVIGANWAINKHWTIRGEYGFLKSKRSLMFNLAYGFGL